MIVDQNFWSQVVGLNFMIFPLCSPTQFFSGFFSRVAGLQPIGTVALFLGFLFLPLAAEAGLPRAAISIPTDQNLAAGLKAAGQCESPGKVIVLPPLSFDFAGGGNAAGVSEEQAQAVQSMPEGSEVWLRVVVGTGSLAGSDSEKQINERVGAFLKSMPLSAAAVRGLIVEIKEPLTAPDLFAFGLVRLTLGAKASNAALRVAFVFQPGFVSQHGDIVKRLATYSDLLGTTYSEGWRQDAAWIAEQALNKPLVLKLDSPKSDAVSSATTSRFVSAMLAASGTSVEIVWSEPPDGKAANAVCTVNSFLTHSITGNAFAADSTASPFSVAVEGAGSSENRSFGSGPSDLVIVVRANGSPGPEDSQIARC